jgi:hypothetical protein
VLETPRPDFHPAPVEGRHGNRIISAVRGPSPVRSVNLQKYAALKDYCEKSGYRIIRKTLVEEERKSPEIILHLREPASRSKKPPIEEPKTS